MRALPVAVVPRSGVGPSGVQPAEVRRPVREPRAALRALALMLALVPAFCGWATARAESPGIVVQLENDAFVLGPKTDRWYTGGGRLMAFADDGGLAARLGRRLLPAGRDDTAFASAITLTQLVYTPDDPPSGGSLGTDRPAGAWLSIGLFAQQHHGRLTEAAELKLGPTGPAALGRPVQNAIHRMLGVSRNDDWARQVRPSLGAEYGWSLQWRGLGAPGPIALVPRLSTSVGTVRRDVAVGVSLLAGSPPAGLLVGGLEGRTVPVSDPDAAGMPGPLPGGLHGWIDLQVRRAGRQAFIDGDVYGPSPAIRRRPWVGEISLGIALPLRALPGRPTLALTTSVRGPEFGADPAPAAPRQRIGALTLIFAR